MSPPVLSRVLDVHLAKIRPSLVSSPAPGVPSVYLLNITKVQLRVAGGAEPEIVQTGDGELVGPLNLSSPAHRDALYQMHPNHMPALREHMEAQPLVAKKLLVITGLVETTQGDSSRTEAHYVVLGIED